MGPAQPGAPSMINIQPEPAPAYGWRLPAMPFDNVRLGLTQFQNRQVTRLFDGPGVSLGLDVPLGAGLAVAFDSTNIRQDFDAAHYWLSVNPVLVRYRLALNEGRPIRPFVTLGGGLAGMGLFGDGPQPRLGLGPAASGGLGLAWNNTLALELGAQAGQVSQIPYWGWQLRVGTGFGALDSLSRWLPQAPAAHVKPAAPTAPTAALPAPPRVSARSLSGQVLEVTGDRVVVGYDQAPSEGVGEDLLVYYQDGIVVKVAKVRVETLTADGRAIARVLDSTEPIRKGYRVRGW
jgi:hypothetical protein